MPRTRLAYRKVLKSHFGGDVSDPVMLEDAKRRLKNCSFLTCDGSVAWSFIHKSFMEFFCAQVCYRDYVSGAVDFTASFPMHEDHISRLCNLLNALMRTERWA